jgi:hypothetical protein
MKMIILYDNTTLEYTILFGLPVCAPFAFVVSGRSLKANSFQNTFKQNYEMEEKINALKDFTLFGSSKKTSNSDSLGTSHNPSSSSTQNGQWGNWFNKKPEEDPYLPSLVR